MKLVIADDENLVRLSLRSMINDLEAAWDIVGEATNGEELLELLAEYKPNVAIVDIRMPKMGGLEAIRTGKSISPLTKWLILSGYSDFGCAQEALKLGASEYLLKPVSPAELDRALLDTYKDNKDMLILHNQQFENNMFALTNGLISMNREERGGMLFESFFTGSLFLLDAPGRDNQESTAQRDLYRALAQCVSDHLVYGMNLALIALPGGELAAVGAWAPGAGPEARRQVGRFFDCAEKVAYGFRGNGVMITTMQTGESRGFAEMNRKLQQLQHWGGLRTVCGLGRRFDYKELEEEAEDPGKLAAGRLLSAAHQHCQDRLYLHYQNAVGELEPMLAKSDLMKDEKSVQAIQTFLRHTFGIELPNYAAPAEAFRELRKYGEKFLRDMKPKEEAQTDLVQHVIQYLEKHYMDDIGIGQIASQLNITANYLSTLFHKKTGITFIKYLTRLRMSKAEELLLNTNLQIKQIAEEVGYFSTRHFTKLFTETFGRYPSDYRKNTL